MHFFREFGWSLLTSNETSVQAVIERLKVKGGDIALNGTSILRATERHLPYGITQCYLPPNTGKGTPP